jgi:polyhydroxyalkanoate synthase
MSEQAGGESGSGQNEKSSFFPFRLGDAIWSAGMRAIEMERLLLTAKEAPVGQTPKELIWRKNKSRLYRYVRTSPATRKTPVFLCMPLINRSYILDLRPGASFVEFLLSQGHDVFLLDWGMPGDEDKILDIESYVTQYLHRALRKASQASGGVPLTLLGYCIGGALSTCYMALYSDENPPVKNLVLFTTPLDFTDAGRFGKWTKKEYFPIEKLTDIFPRVPSNIPEFGSKMLAPVPSALGVYVRLWEKLSQQRFDTHAWQSMYRWVNDGVPFPSGAYRQWIKDFYQDNKLYLGSLRMAGKPVLLKNIRCPLLNVVASSDDIAPRTTTENTLSAVGSTDKAELIVQGGHVGIVVGRAASATLWPKVGEWLGKHD